LCIFFTQFGDEVQSLGDQQLLGQRLREIALVAKELARQAFHEFGKRMPIIDVAWSEAKGQDLALVIDDQVQLEAIESADRGLATCGSSLKDPMLMDASVVADGKRGGVDKANTTTAAQLRMQIGHQWYQQGRHQLDEALVAHQGRKLAVQMTLDIFGVVGFERAVVRLLEQDHNGHHFAGMHLRLTQTLSLTLHEQGRVPGRSKLLPEIVYGTKDFEYTHNGTSWRYTLGFFFADLTRNGSLTRTHINLRPSHPYR
jgi:hypothetical protein